MKAIKAIHVLAAVAVALLASGCAPQRPPDVADKPLAPDTQSPPLPDAVKPPSEATRPVPEPLPQATQTPATGAKDQFVAAVEKRLQDLDTNITKLGEKIGPSDEYAKTALHGLHELRAKAGVKFNEIKQSGQEAWTELKPQLELAMNELEKAYEDLKSRITT